MTPNRLPGHQSRGWVERWLADQSAAGHDSLIRVQVQQATARIALGLLGLLYLALHAPYFPDYARLFLPLAVAYLALNALMIPMIRRSPLSAARALLIPLADIGIVSFGMVLDGGHGSGLYLVLLVIIFGNAFRYGNTMLIYSQAAAVLGLTAASIFTLTHLHLDIDRVLLVWQMLGLIALPLYVFLIGKRAQHAIRQQQEAETASFKLLDAGPVPVFTFDLDADGQPRILYCNAAMDRIHRDDWLSLIGEQPDILALQEDGEEMLRQCRAAIERRDGAPAVFYIRGRNKQDQVLRLMCTTSRIKWHGRWIGVCFVLDITRQEDNRRELDEQHRHGYMSALVAGMVHDFRNILTNILGQAEILQMEQQNPELHKAVQPIIDASERGSKMIDNMLQISRRGEQVALESITGERLRNALEDILGLARLQLPPNVQLAVHLDPALPDMDIGIVGIEQVLLNLIHNAAHALEGRDQGCIEVHIRADTRHRLAKESAPALSIKVRDDGPGIPAEDLPHIFRPFWTKRAGSGGTGLGLAMVRRIVRRHGGEIEVNSSPNQGTCFHIVLPPSGSAPDQPAEESASTGTTAEEAPRPQRILLVDDAPDVLAIHQRLAGRAGHSIHPFTDPCLALAAFRKHPDAFDLVITDFRMPGMDGLELTRAIRRLHPDIPVLMITAYGEEDALRQAQEDCFEVLTKPVSFEALKHAISRAARCRRRAAGRNDHAPDHARDDQSG